MTDALSLLDGQRVFIIAEAGVNHNGDPELGMRLIEAAHAAGADAVKFQTWKPGEITGRFTPKAAYLEITTEEAESRYQMSSRLALPYDDFRRLRAHAQQVGILFLSTPDGPTSLEFLAGELELPIIKVGSTEVTHFQFLEQVGSWGRPVILSTGLSTLGEVERAVQALGLKDGQRLVLLHCTSQYPAPAEEMNLKAMVTMGQALGWPVGLSDHSEGLEAAVAAVALGAKVIEKHFTLDRNLPGPDHQASLDPGELAALVRAIRRTEVMLGDGRKRPTPSELANRVAIRRSVVAAADLPAGSRLTREMLTCKRPGSGLAPELLDSLVGLRINRALAEDEPLTWEVLR